MKILRSTKVLYAVILLTMLNLFTPVEVIYLTGMGIPISLVSVLNLLVPLTCAVVEVPTGIVADYYGRKKALLISLLAFFFSMVILIESSTFFGFAFVFILEGIGWSFFSGNNDAMIVENANERSANISKQLAFFYSGFALGTVLSGAFNSYLSTMFSFQNFKILIIVSLLFRFVAIFVAMFVHEAPKSKTAGVIHESPIGLLLDGIKLIKSNSFNFAIVIYESTGRLTYYIPVIVQPILLSEKLDFAFFGIVYTVAQLFAYITQRYADIIVAKLGIRCIIKYSQILIATFILLLLIPRIEITVVSFVGILAIGPLRQQCLNLQKNSFVSDGIRATYLSAISFCVLVINSAILFFTGLLIERYLLLGLTVLSLICFLGGLMNHDKISKVVVGKVEVPNRKGVIKHD